MFKNKGSTDWSAYQRALDTGYLVHATKYFKSRGRKKVGFSVRFTPKGLTKISQMLADHSEEMAGRVSHAKITHKRPRSRHASGGLFH